MNEQDCKKLAELLFPDVDKTPDYMRRNTHIENFLIRQK